MKECKSVRMKESKSQRVKERQIQSERETCSMYAVVVAIDFGLKLEGFKSASSYRKPAPSNVFLEHRAIARPFSRPHDPRAIQKQVYI